MAKTTEFFGYIVKLHSSKLHAEDPDGDRLQYYGARHSWDRMPYKVRPYRSLRNAAKKRDKMQRRFDERHKLRTIKLTLVKLEFTIEDVAEVQ